jgi:hypothetical protein
MLGSQLLDGRQFEVSRPHQRIEACDGIVEAATASNVERGALRRRHGKPVDLLNLVLQ